MDLLTGITVIEAASYISGPFAGLMFADLGADVVKVEPPPSGDPFRRFGRRVNGGSVLFANTNRGKRSVLLDLKNEEDLQGLHDLLARADIFITNWRPGVAEGLGLDAEAVRRYHPRLIWVRISGFGQDGPLRSRLAFDPLIQARTALASLQGDDIPQLVRAYFADKTSAMYTVQVALAALHRRGASGEGAVIDLAMLDALAYFNFPDMLVNHSVPSLPVIGAAIQTGAVRPVRTKDGWIVVSPVSGRHIAAALTTVGRPELLDEIKAIKDPAEITRAIYDGLEQVTRGRTSAEWEELFTENGVPCSAVLEVEAHLLDEQVIHNGVYGEVMDSTIGPMRRARYPVFVDGRRLKDGASAPRPGESDADQKKRSVR